MIHYSIKLLQTEMYRAPNQCIYKDPNDEAFSTEPAPRQAAFSLPPFNLRCPFSQIMTEVTSGFGG